MTNLFPSFSKARDDKSLAKLNELKQGSLFHSIEYEITGILNKIDNIDNIDESEIKQIIIRQHQTILNYDLFLESSETRAKAQELFTNKRFLKCFLDVIGLLELTIHEKTCLNKLAYDYYIYKDINKDIEVSNLLFQLTTWANGNEVVVLSGILGMNGAKILSMIRHSSFKEEKNIHRVNTFIIKCDIKLSIQNIIDIFCFLYERFTPLFIFSMLEQKPSGLTEDQNKRFDAISIALLVILDSLNSSDMKKVLCDYAFTLGMTNKAVRFSLKTAKGYPRILSVLKDIEIVEELYIP
jgi:hypothetical protein